MLFHILPCSHGRQPLDCELGQTLLLAFHLLSAFPTWGEVQKDLEKASKTYRYIYIFIYIVLIMNSYNIYTTIKIYGALYVLCAFNLDFKHRGHAMACERCVSGVSTHATISGIVFDHL